VGTAPDYRLSENLLNTCGYFLEFGPDVDRPAFITPQLVPQRYRYRLKELTELSQNMTLYKYTSGEESPGKNRSATYNGLEWFRAPLGNTAPPVRTLAENVLALVLLPQLTAQDEPTGLKLAPEFKYDSTKTAADAQLNPRNQLPPVMQLTLVALAEQSAARIDAGGTAPPAWLDQQLGKLFKKAADLPKDRQTLEDALAARRLNYRIFSTNVSLKGAKWSTEQKN
jgi:uncharacterized protein (TIGR02599 family)